MSDSYALALQKAVRARLVGDSTITNLVSTRVYDEPPAEPAYPFIRFGDITPRTADTDGSLNAEVALNIEAYSRATGRVEAAQIAEAIRTSLHRSEANVSVAGFHLIELRCEAYFVDRDREGRGYSVNVVLSAMLETA